MARYREKRREEYLEEKKPSDIEITGVPSPEASRLISILGTLKFEPGYRGGAVCASFRNFVDLKETDPKFRYKDTFLRLLSYYPTQKWKGVTIYHNAETQRVSRCWDEVKGLVEVIAEPDKPKDKQPNQSLPQRA